MEKLLDVKEMSEKLKISSQKLRQMCRDKKIPHIRMADEVGAGIRFDPQVIEAWIRGKIIEDSGFAPADPPRRGRPPKARDQKPEE